ncbi:X-Pro dipeptidyl-peptidase family protein [Pseudomonas fluorescens]|uniref:X-Pro dipeptidyl-peptidase family protein n=2 Tax=Pseudomonas fluorescens TaxID=294 RepID=A0A0P8XWS0_PSEFL|nr:alpha/beta hydrolase [Pseudomonas fluorescens]KPU61864.1 X-Pro dipeptidyl-peptidase family protein [Pseudomonas fluorescens]
MRQDISFDAEGVILRGWLYKPDGLSPPCPAIVMAHGFTAVKEMYLDSFAEVFCEAGFAVLVFDNRNFGASDGAPRYEVDPVQQVRDYRHAISFISTLDGIDKSRVGVWGSSYSGGHVLKLAAIDRRVKCVVSQVPMISGSENLRRAVRPDHIPSLRAMLDDDRMNRFRGEAPGTIPAVSEDPAQPCAMPQADAWEWFSTTAESRAPAWKNEVTLRSLEMLMEYEPGCYIRSISPTPLLLIAAPADHLNPGDEQLAAFERALEPKKLTIIPGGHFDAYSGPNFDVTSGEAVGWFKKHLS